MSRIRIRQSPHELVTKVRNAASTGAGTRQPQSLKNRPVPGKRAGISHSFSRLSPLMSILFKEQRWKPARRYSDSVNNATVPKAPSPVRMAVRCNHTKAVMAELPLGSEWRSALWLRKAAPFIIQQGPLSLHTTQKCVFRTYGSENWS